MFGFLRRDRKTGSGQSGPGEVTARETYEGFLLLARPRRDGGQWRVAGTIRREGDAEDGPAFDFVRADTMADPDEATRMCLVKARQIVDEQGERLLEGS